MTSSSLATLLPFDQIYVMENGSLRAGVREAAK